MKTILRHVKWFFQRRTRGFDDRELWDLGSHLVKYIYPRLVAFKNMERTGITIGDSNQETENALNEMIWAFKMDMEDSLPEQRCFQCTHCRERIKKDGERMEKGFEMFGKYLRLLWD